MENRLKRLMGKKVTVTTPNDSFTGKLVFNFGYLNRSEYFVDGYENETFTARDVKSILGNKIKLTKDFDAMESTNESTKAYGDALKAIAKDRQLKNLSKKDRDTLVKISKLLDKEKNEELNQDDEDKVKEVIAMLKKASKAHAGQADDLQKAVNEVKTNRFTLNDMDDNDAAVVTAMAKKAGVFLRNKKVSMTRSDVELKGDKKKIFKFINSLPEAHYKGKKLLKGQKTLQEKEIKGLRKKAEKSGMPYSVLKQVYNRGMAAWKTGHRPGTTPQQWAMARVNSFTTKSSGTWGGADKDLAAKVRGSKKK